MRNHFIAGVAAGAKRPVPFSRKKLRDRDRPAGSYPIAHEQSKIPTTWRGQLRGTSPTRPGLEADSSQSVLLGGRRLHHAGDDGIRVHERPVVLARQESAAPGAGTGAVRQGCRGPTVEKTDGAPWILRGAGFVLPPTQGIMSLRPRQAYDRLTGHFTTGRWISPELLMTPKP